MTEREFERLIHRACWKFSALLSKNYHGRRWWGYPDSYSNLWISANAEGQFFIGMPGVRPAESVVDVAGPFDSFEAAAAAIKLLV